jgi:hypothetical protein
MARSRVLLYEVPLSVVLVVLDFEVVLAKEIVNLISFCVVGFVPTGCSSDV